MKRSRFVIRNSRAIFAHHQGRRYIFIREALEARMSFMSINFVSYQHTNEKKTIYIYVYIYIK